MPRNWLDVHSCRRKNSLGKRSGTKVYTPTLSQHETSCLREDEMFKGMKIGGEFP